MHFAFPNRQADRPSSPSFKAAKRRSFRLPHFHARRRPAIFILLTFIVAFLFLRSRRKPDEHYELRKASPDTVLVTMLDNSTLSRQYTFKVIQNRQWYANRWNHVFFAAEIGDYQAAHGNIPKTFAKLPLIRHAMTKHPYAVNFWYLAPNALIMNHEINLDTHLLRHDKLNSVMMRDYSIIPPDSVIKTFKNVDAESVQLILTQDAKEISTDSFIVRRVKDELPGSKPPRKGEFGAFLLDTWNDPLYQKYHRFKNGDRDALQHIVQWHHTLLSKLAIVPQRLLNSYASGDKAQDGRHVDLGYKPGDLVVSFDSCKVPEKDCDELFDKYYKDQEKSAIEAHKILNKQLKSIKKD